MPTLSQIKKDIKMAVAESMESALVKGEALLSPKSERYLVLKGIKHRYMKARDQFQDGTLSNEETELLVRQLERDFLKRVVDKLKGEDLHPEAEVGTNGTKQKNNRRKKSNEKPSNLNKGTLQLEPDDLALLFKERFKLMEDTPVQHYFLHAGWEMQPVNFVENLILEMEADSKLVLFEVSGEKRVLVKEINHDHNLEISQLEFREYFSRRFGVNISSLKDMETVFRAGFHYPYIVTVLKFQVEEWHHTRPAFLDWLMEEFCATGSDFATKFLFFHIVQKGSPSAEFRHGLARILGIKSGKQKMAENTLALLEKRAYCTVFPEIKPTSSNALTIWLEKYLDNKKTASRLLNKITRRQIQRRKKDTGPVKDKFAEVLGK